MQGCFHTQPIWSTLLKPGAFFTLRSGSFKNMQKQQSHTPREGGIGPLPLPQSGNFVDCLQSEPNQPPHPNKLACAFSDD